MDIIAIVFGVVCVILGTWVMYNYTLEMYAYVGGSLLAKVLLLPTVTMFSALAGKSPTEAEGRLYEQSRQEVARPRRRLRRLIKEGRLIFAGGCLLILVGAL